MHVARTNHLPARVLDRLPRLKAIVVTDGNVRTIDYAAAARNGVAILEGKAPADLPIAPASTAEFAWGLILATVRHIPREVQRLREGIVAEEPRHAAGGQNAGHRGTWAESARAWRATRAPSTCTCSRGATI